MTDCIKHNHAHIAEKLKGNSGYQDRVLEASNIYSLLGEPNRMKIVLALAEGELCVYHLMEITGGKQSATSQHLRKLKDNHIVKCRKDANQVLYSLADEHIAEIVKLTIEHLNCK